MGKLENPAGRLHNLLTKFGEQPQGTTIARGWAAALGVNEKDVRLQLGAVGELLREVLRAVSELNDPAFSSMEGNLTTLSECIFPSEVAYSNSVDHVRPDPHAMQMLGALSFALQLTAPDGQVPGDEEFEVLRQSVRDLIDEMAAADLPPEVRRAMLTRLNDMLEALDHLNIGGPSAVRKAAEALAISALIYEGEESEDSSVFQKVKGVARKTWVAFTVTTSLASALLTWEKVVSHKSLNPAVEQRQLPAPSVPPDDTGDGPDSSPDSEPTPGPEYA